jgi:hypothetical protein
VLKVCNLPREWELWADTECHEISVRPLFVRGKRKLTPVEMSLQPEAHLVFRDVKRLLDVMDAQFVRGDSIEWRGLDVAKMSLQLALQQSEKWERSLLENEVMGAR